MRLKSRIKNMLGAIGLSFCLFGASAPAHAGIPVIDVANLVQSIMEVLAWYQQAQDMINQIQEAKNTVAGIKTTISKLDGARNLGSILNDPNIRGNLPPEMQNAAGILMNPTAVTASPASVANVLAAFGITVPATGVTPGTEAAAGLLKNQSLLQSAQTREAQLAQLAAQVDAAPDQKSSTDLVSRTNIENANIMNTLIQTLAAQDLARQQAQMRRIAASQAEQARLVAFLAANPLP